MLVGGCAAQKDKELVRDRAPWVDVVIGTHNTNNVINLLNQSEDWGPITQILEESKDIESEILPVREKPGCAQLLINSLPFRLDVITVVHFVLFHLLEV